MKQCGTNEMGRREKVSPVWSDGGPGNFSDKLLRRRRWGKSLWGKKLNFPNIKNGSCNLTSWRWRAFVPQSLSLTEEKRLILNYLRFHNQDPHLGRRARNWELWVRFHLDAGKRFTHSFDICVWKRVWGKLIQFFGFARAYALLRCDIWFDFPAYKFHDDDMIKVD